MVLVVSARIRCTSMRSSSTINWKLREYRKSPTSTDAALPHTAFAVLRPRRRLDSSTTSSCSRVEVWMNSTTAASWCASVLRCPRAPALSSSSIGRSRLPPAPMMYSATWLISTTSEASRWRISASIAAISGAARAWIALRSSRGSGGRALSGMGCRLGGCGIIGRSALAGPATRWSGQQGVRCALGHALLHLVAHLRQLAADLLALGHAFAMDFAHFLHGLDQLVVDVAQGFDVDDRALVGLGRAHRRRMHQVGVLAHQFVAGVVDRVRQVDRVALVGQRQLDRELVSPHRDGDV